MTTAAINMLDWDFGNVSAGDSAYLAVEFALTGGGPVQFSVGAAPAAFVALTSVNILPQQGAKARVWFKFPAPAALGAVGPGDATISATEYPGGTPVPISWPGGPAGATTVTVHLHATVVSAPKDLAVSLVLDRSGSMANIVSGTTTRMDLLKAAAGTFVDLLPARWGLVHSDRDGIGVVAFSTDAEELSPVGPAGAGGAGTTAAHTAIDFQLIPSGVTSIGDGIKAATEQLSVAAYTRSATLVVTDGLENEPLMISDVVSMGLINGAVYAIGIGSASQVNTAALTALCANHGNGYLLLTGTSDLSATKVQKYFMQILAGVTNADIILDRTAYLTPGSTRKQQFPVTELESEITAVVLCDQPQALTFTLYAPDGTQVDGSQGMPGVEQRQVDGMSFVRVALPIAGIDQRGWWTAYLGLDRGTDLPGHDRRGLRTDLSVLTTSALRLGVRVKQRDFRPGSKVAVAAVLTLGDTVWPVPARVAMTIRRPDGVLEDRLLKQSSPGSFDGRFEADIAGSYAIELTASGSLDIVDDAGQVVGQQEFSRFATRTVAVFDGSEEERGTQDPLEKRGPGGLRSRIDRVLSPLGRLFRRP